MKKANLLAACLLLCSCFVGRQYSGCWANPASADAADRIHRLNSPAEAVGTDTSSSKIIYQEWHDSQRGRDIPIKIYLPKNISAPQPVVIFSHGLGGSREAAVYLGDYWSQHGYVGIFVQHPGSDTAVWQSARAEGKEAMMQRMKEAANGRNLVDRAADIKFVLNELEKRNQTDPDLKNHMDLGKVALAGHSFGAGTTLAIAGENFGEAHRNIKDNRVKAAIYLCPPVGAGKIAPEQTYGSIEIPGLLLTGTEDNSPIGTTTAADRRIPFDGIKAPHQYLVNFIGADHAVFGGRSFRAAKEGDERFHEMIEELTTKFLEATLKGDAAAWKWLDSTEASAYLGKAATMERK